MTSKESPSVADPLYIGLTQGHTALISREDAQAILPHKWHAVRCGRGQKLYARRENVYMHRLIMAGQLDEGLVVDHINGDGLDNRRENLRVVTNSANSRNLQVYNNPTGFRGVFLQSGKFIARIASKYLGCYETALEGAFAVNKHLTTLDGQIGFRNAIDYDELIRILAARRDAIDSEIAAVERARI